MDLAVSLAVFFRNQTSSVLATKHRMTTPLRDHHGSNPAVPGSFCTSKRDQPRFPLSHWLRAPWRRGRSPLSRGHTEGSRIFFPPRAFSSCLGSLGSEPSQANEHPAWQGPRALREGERREAQDRCRQTRQRDQGTERAQAEPRRRVFTALTSSPCVRVSPKLQDWAMGGRGAQGACLSHQNPASPSTGPGTVLPLRAVKLLKKNTITGYWQTPMHVNLSTL